MAFRDTLNKFGVPLVPGTNGLGILMPKLKYRFRVDMVSFGDIGSTIEVTRQVVTCGRPSIQHNSTALHSYNNVMYIPQKPEWQTIEITVRDDITNSVSRQVAKQLQKQMNHFDQTSGIAGMNYKFLTQIETLDGTNDTTLENWYLEGCYLETVAYDSYDYASSDPMVITLTVRYDNATQDSNIMPSFVSPNARGPLAGI